MNQVFIFYILHKLFSSIGLLHTVQALARVNLNFQIWDLENLYFAYIIHYYYLLEENVDISQFISSPISFLNGL